MSSKRSLGFCVKNGLVNPGDKIKFESGWETVIRSISKTDVLTDDGKVFDFTSKIYPPKKIEKTTETVQKKVTVTIKCVTFHEITVNAKDLQEGLLNVDAMPRWTALKDAELIDYEIGTFEIEGAVVNC